jgi:hypothetical protein
MTARTLFELGALSALVAMTRGALWKCPADFDRPNPFHALRHTAIMNDYRASKDLFLAQRFPRLDGAILRRPGSFGGSFRVSRGSEFCHPRRQVRFRG